MVLLFFGATLGAAQEETPLPEGNAYVRSVLAGPRPQDTAINDYSYDLEEVRENLDASGHPTSRETRGYEVYFVQTRPVKRLVSRNGTPLTAKEQAEVDRKAEAQAQAIAEGRTVSEQPGIRLKTLLDSFEFKTAGREMRGGRKTLVFDFEPRRGARPPSQDRAAGEIARILAGRLHIDEEDRRVARARRPERAGREGACRGGREGRRVRVAHGVHGGRRACLAPPKSRDPDHRSRLLCSRRSGFGEPRPTRTTEGSEWKSTSTSAVRGLFPQETGSGRAREAAIREQGEPDQLVESARGDVSIPFGNAGGIGGHFDEVESDNRPTAFDQGPQERHHLGE